MSNHPNDTFVKKNVNKLRDFVSKWNQKTDANINGKIYEEIVDALKTENEHLSTLNKLNKEKIDLLNEKLELVHQIVKRQEEMIEAHTRMIESQNKVLLEVQSHKRLIEELQHTSEDFETRISNLENFMEELTEDA